MAIDTSKVDLSNIQDLTKPKTIVKTVQEIQENKTNNDFPYELELQGRKIKFRTWKLKDKENLLKAKTNYEKKKVLVYNCLEKPDTPLDYLEYEYVLFSIRNASLPNYVTSYVIRCPDCGEVFKCNVHFSNILDRDIREYKEIKSGDISIKVDNIKNQKFYEEMISNIEEDEQKILIDFVLHISEFNGRLDLSASDIVKILNNLEIEQFEDIFKQWNEMRFAFKTVGYVECPECGREDQYDFKQVDNFYPKSWQNIAGI